MESPRGRILSVHSDTEPAHAVVEVVTAFRCARCASGKGCGAGLIGGDEESRRIDALLPPGMAVGPGDEVRIELAPDNILRAAAIVYGFPLSGAVTGAALAWALGAGDAGAAITALAGVAVGMLAGRMRLSRITCLRRFTPTVRPHG